MALNTPLAAETVTRQVIERIRKALVERELKPGDKLPTENELCNMWQVSRTPIREAIKVLEFMGILEIRRSEGTFICSEFKSAALNPTILKLVMLSDSVEQFLDFRYEVEHMVLRHAMAKATADDIETMNANITAMESAFQQGSDAEILLSLEIEFHHSVANATGNVLIRELAVELYEVFAKSVRKSHASGGSRDAVSHHKKIMNAIKNRDMTLGETALRESLSVWRTYIDTSEQG